MDKSNIFKDLLVIELASVLAGPAVGMFFAELGAKVIKIENLKTGGDVTRKWKLPSESPEDEYSAYYHSINWGKETLLLDLSHEEDRDQVFELIKQADIVISNFKTGSAKKLGMDYASLKQINSRIIYASISAYGTDNSSPGFDAMLQAETGWMSMTGEPNGKPVKLPVALVDILAGHQLKQGVLIALMEREKSGKGSKVDVSLFDASVASLANQASNWLNVGVVPKRMGSQHPNIAPYGDVFETKDGQAIVLGTGTQKQFEGLCQILELDRLIEDERFRINTERLKNRALLLQVLREEISQIEYDSFKKQCTERSVTMAPINNLKQVFQLPQAKELLLSNKTNPGIKTVRTAVFRIEP